MSHENPTYTYPKAYSPTTYQQQVERSVEASLTEYRDRLKKRVNEKTAEAQPTLFENTTVEHLPIWDGLPNGWTPREALNRLTSAIDNWELFSSDELQIRDLIAIYGLMLTDLLLKKNDRYGNSVTDPVSVFAKNVTRRERMHVRMDDKISRIVRGGSFGDKEDPRIDLAGYLLLDLILDAMETEK